VPDFETGGVTPSTGIADWYRRAVGGAATERDDRLLAPTLWTAVLIVPVLVAAFVILYLFPAHTHRL
jgi:hypothetical protein